MSDIKELREKINKIDENMASLFEERMKISKDVALYKQEHGLDILDKNREDEVIKKNLDFVCDDYKDYYVNFIKEVMNESKKYQSSILKGKSIAYSGVPGAYAYIAAKKMYPDSVLVSYPNFKSAYEACSKGEVDYCVLPIENSSAGEVGDVLDLLFEGDLKINKMMDLEINHYLLGVKGSKKEDIRIIYSHPQAISQCEEYLNKHQIDALPSVNTAVAAKYIKELNDEKIGSIASLETAEIYGLEVLDSKINAYRNNTTRFASFSRVERTPSKDVKMGEHFILVYTVINKAGALADTLNIIGSHNFNMRNVKSRPMKELMWNYYFFVEVEGNINSRDGEELLKELSSICDRLKLVGTYYDFKEK